MKTATYVLRSNQTLGAKWEDGIKKLALWLDGQPLGEFTSKDCRGEGKNIELPGGGALNLRFLPSRLFGSNSDWQISHNGAPVPNSFTADHLRYKDATGCLFVIAVITALSAVLFLVVGLSDLQSGGLIAFAAAVVFLGLAFLVRRRSELALWVAVILYGIDSIWAVGNLLAAGQLGAQLYGAIGLRILAFTFLVPGISALRNLRGS